MRLVAVRSASIQPTCLTLSGRHPRALASISHCPYYSFWYLGRIITAKQNPLRPSIKLDGILVDLQPCVRKDGYNLRLSETTVEVLGRILMAAMKFNRDFSLVTTCDRDSTHGHTSIC
jgi:hypothetical protein